MRAMPPEPPQNGEYLVAAYVITTVILMGYWVALWRRGNAIVRGRGKDESGEEKNVSG
jgi:hypothetical protein